MQTLPLEFELRLSQIATQYYPHRRYKLVSTIEANYIDIKFQGYFAESFNPRNRPSTNPNDEFYRDKEIDFTVSYGSGILLVFGRWRREILTFDYNNKYWINEDNEEIYCPYPDGKKCEKIAADIYPLFEKYFQ